MLSGDVSDETVVRHLVGSALDRFGSLHVAFNNAGVPGPMKPIEELDAARFVTGQTIYADGGFAIPGYR